MAAAAIQAPHGDQASPVTEIGNSQFIRRHAEMAGQIAPACGGRKSLLRLRHAEEQVQLGARCAPRTAGRKVQSAIWLRRAHATSGRAAIAGRTSASSCHAIGAEPRGRTGASRVAPGGQGLRFGPVTTPDRNASLDPAPDRQRRGESAGRRRRPSVRPARPTPSTPPSSSGRPRITDQQCCVRRQCRPGGPAAGSVPVEAHQANRATSAAIQGSRSW